jgi:hypothetical protein
MCWRTIQKNELIYRWGASVVSNISAVLSMLRDRRAIAPSCLFLGVIAFLFAVDQVGWPAPGAMCRIATCRGRFVDVESRPAMFSGPAFPAPRCCWSYTGPGEAVVHDRVRPCLSERGTDERLMVVNRQRPRASPLDVREHVTGVQ